MCTGAGGGGGDGSVISIRFPLHSFGSRRRKGRSVVITVGDSASAVVIRSLFIKDWPIIMLSVLPFFIFFLPRYFSNYLPNKHDSSTL